MLERFLIVWLSLLSLLAFGWSHYSWDYDPFQTTAPHLGWLITFTMLVIGGLLPPDEIKQIFQKWKMVLSGTALQFLIMPGAAYFIGTFFGLPQELFIGMILVGTVPGAMASNILTLLSKGNVSYSVCLTTSATLISPFIVPIILYLAVQVKGIDQKELLINSFVSLITMLFIPVITGYILARISTFFEKLFQYAGPTCANLSVLWIIAVVVNKSESKISNGSLSVNILLLLVFALLVVNLIGFIGGYLGGKLLPIDEGMRRALTLEIGMQNAGLGAVMAGQLFKEEVTVALPPALYSFVCMFTGTFLALYWSRQSNLSKEATSSPTTL